MLSGEKFPGFGLGLADHFQQEDPRVRKANSRYSGKAIIALPL